MTRRAPGTGNAGTGNIRRAEILAGATYEQIGRALGVGRPLGDHGPGSAR